MAGYIGTKASVTVVSTETDNRYVNASGDTMTGDLTVSANLKADTIVNQSGDNDSGLDLSTNDVVAVKTGNTERMRIDSSGNLLVGKTSTSFSTEGFVYEAGAAVEVTTDSARVLRLNRTSTDGDIAVFNKDGSTVGSIGAQGNYLHIEGSTAGAYGLKFVGSSYIRPSKNAGGISDNELDLGASGSRWDDIYATNGSIQTSDRNEKQDIAALTATEMLVAARISAMFKTYRWIDKATENPNARTHTGIIAQDVQQAFTDEGLDAGDYSLFVSATWDDENGNSQTRMGIRYPELLSFIAAYNEQRFASIETRLAALETN